MSYDFGTCSLVLFPLFISCLSSHSEALTCCIPFWSLISLFVLSYFPSFPFCSTFWNFFSLSSNTPIECWILALLFFPVLVFSDCSCFYSILWEFYVSALFRFLSGSFILVFIFHCWRSLQMFNYSWYQFMVSSSPKALPEWAGLVGSGFHCNK